jgi:hypothetical protein
MYRMWYTLLLRKKPKSPTGIHTHPEALERQGKRVPAIFFRTEGGGEPIREWLKGLSPEDRKRIGEDIKTVEFGWPIGNRASPFLHRQKGPNGPAPRIHQENAEDAERGFGPGAPQQE